MPDYRGRPAPCPPTEDLSGYVDGTVPEATRRSIEAHLGECDTCYDVIVETSAWLEHSPPAMAAARSRRPVGWLIGVLALAAAVVLVVRVGMRTGTPDKGTLANIVAAVGPRRLIEPRLTGGFAYGVPSARMRGILQGSDQLALFAAAAEANNAARSRPGPETARASAVGALLLGQDDSAVEQLTRLCAARPKDGSCEADLGAALLARHDRTGSAADLESAAAHTDRAVQLQPTLDEAAFNRALVLEREGRLDEAAVAWAKYEVMDPGSPWADEARRHRAGLAR